MCCLGNLIREMLPRTTKKNTITYTPTGRLYKCCCFNDHVPMVLGFNPNGLPLFFCFPHVSWLLVIHCKTAYCFQKKILLTCILKKFIWLVDDL